MLEIEHLAVSYPGVTAVNDVSFELKPGERLGIMGESGCGKSTLALSIMGLARGTRQEGLIRYQGGELDETALSRLRWTSMAMVFQNGAEVMNPVLTVFEQLDEAVKTHTALTKKQRKQTILSWLERVGLDRAFVYEYPHRLSGGMRQRVFLAMALCCDPELLILDEPTSSLDARTRAEMLDLIDELQHEKGFSLILISHQVSAVRRLTHRLLTLYAGQVMETGPTEQVLGDPRHPYTRGLINASPDFQMFKELWGIPAARTNGHTKNRGCPFSTRCVQAGADCPLLRPSMVEPEPSRKVACHKGGIETLLAADRVSKRFSLNRGHIRALDRVSLNLKSGEIVAVLGKTGSGKSTLAHVLAGLTRPDQGSVRLWDAGLDLDRAARIPRGLQLVFQDPYAATSHRMTVMDTVCEPLVILGADSPETWRDKAVAALAQVELPTDTQFLETPCHALSGGQRQRVALARALVMEPRILIADEITSMLDPSTRANLLRTLMGLQNAKGFSMVFITHDLFLARKVADRVLVMDRGLCVEQGPAMEVFARPKHPSTQRLMVVGMGSPEDLWTHAFDANNQTRVDDHPEETHFYINYDMKGEKT